VFVPKPKHSCFQLRQVASRDTRHGPRSALVSVVYKNELALSSRYSLQIHSSHSSETMNLVGEHADHIGSFSYIHDLCFGTAPDRHGVVSPES
jgi:hypothetical protein